MKKRKLGYLILSLLGIVAIIAFALIEPIKQNEAYHNFSDDLAIGCITNFWNVFSNLPFLIIGIWGIYQFRRLENKSIPFLCFLIGISLVAIGSGYYHYNPTNNTLVWDRLPMTIAFTALISVLISEFIHKNIGYKLLAPLLLLGISSILYWILFDDLKLYAFVQFYPILAIPVILILFKSEGQSTKGFWLLLVAYIFAKLLETFDVEIHEGLGFISGHSLKHIAASIGVYLLVKDYVRHKN